MNKILLVNPGTLDKETYGALEPFPVAYLAGFLLQHGYEVKIVDEMAGDDFQKEFSRFSPDIVGVTSTTQLIKRAYQVLDYSRKKGALAVIGGPHASALPDEASQHADIVVIGEGELAILDIAQGNVRSGIVRKHFIPDINRLPPPPRDLLRMDYYRKARQLFPNHIFSFAPADAVTASLITSRGCPYRCIFCYNSWRDMPVRSMSADNVLTELSLLKSKYGVTAVTFADDELFFDKNRASGLFSGMIREKFNFTWCAAARANLVNPELLALAKEAGCAKISIGFESGSQKILDVLNKRTTVEQNRTAVAMCKKAGINIGGYFMIGNPKETLEDIGLTRKFIKDSAIEYVGLFLCTALPGTEMYEKYADKRHAGPCFWEKLNFYDYDISVNDILSRKTIERQYELLSTEIYGKRKIDLTDVLSRHIKHPIYTAKKILSTPYKLVRLFKNILGC